MLFTEVKGSIASEIAAKEALIAQLQAEVSAHLNYAQEVQSSEVASETALQQMQMAIDMLKHIGCPDGLKALERAVKEQFKEAKEPRKKALLTAASPSEGNQANAEAKSADTDDAEPENGEAIEATVTVTPVDEDSNDFDGFGMDYRTNAGEDVGLNATAPATTPNGKYPHPDLFDDAWVSDSEVETSAQPEAVHPF